MAGRAKTEVAAWCGFDLSTTGLALGVRSPSGKEAYAHTPIRGATRWRGQPAFKLEQVPRMLLTLLTTLEKHGWVFRKPVISFAVRQHDMVLLGRANQLLMPVLSWQCNAATAEVEQLEQKGVGRQVGRVEPRFILPKLAWALTQEPSLKREVAQVMTTGDWIAERLTGKARLSTSDAISNGLLDQKTKKLAESAIRKAGLQTKWFPRVLQSGKNVGRVRTRPSEASEAGWQEVCDRLAGGQLVASLGDNHATGVGCGLAEGDYSTIVISAGTSGTINRVCPPRIELAGEAACFEFYKDRMLLMMLADCCSWYDAFVERSAASYADHLGRLDTLVTKADPGTLRRILPGPDGGEGPPNFKSLSVGERAASVQASIMLELLLLTAKMLDEAPDAGPVKRFVLTGGLSQSRFFQQAFSCGVEHLAPGARAEISARKGPLRFQTAAYGGLINAMRSKESSKVAALCPTRPAATASPRREAYFDYFFRSCGLGA
ncbi:MAG: FGGY family carbohydrate kinase [Pirellulales bacterium]|nr:FGGY family carbohydrate kinase [Pirellulales bacterium]